ncbi:hypothetical protein DFH06DRAFT_1209480 [Mycena polygramma]|nr:hypothetical protein DFH06DRAFT_1209480 [Mycena polygramma]
MRAFQDSGDPSPAVILRAKRSWAGSRAVAVWDHAARCLTRVARGSGGGDPALVREARSGVALRGIDTVQRDARWMRLFRVLCPAGNVHSYLAYGVSRYPGTKSTSGLMSVSRRSRDGRLACGAWAGGGCTVGGIASNLAGLQRGRGRARRAASSGSMPIGSDGVLCPASFPFSILLICDALCRARISVYHCCPTLLEFLARASATLPL